MRSYDIVYNNGSKEDIISCTEYSLKKVLDEFKRKKWKVTSIKEREKLKTKRRAKSS